MRHTDYYYLQYPNDCPVDPSLAATEMYVELREEGDPEGHNQGTYAFQVCTFRYVQEEFIKQGRPLAGRSVMIVPTLADDWMREFLKANIDALPTWSEDRG